MLNWNTLKDRLWLWLAGFAVSAFIVAAMYLAAIHPISFAVLTFPGELPLLALLWLPIVIYLLRKSGTTLSMPIVYYCYVVLLFRVAGPALPSHGIWVWLRDLGTGFAANGALGATLLLTLIWVWQSKCGNGAKQTWRRGKRPSKADEKELNVGEKYA